MKDLKNEKWLSGDNIRAMILIFSSSLFFEVSRSGYYDYLKRINKPDKICPMHVGVTDLSNYLNEKNGCNLLTPFITNSGLS
jgi:hypothetical protein